MTLNHEEIVKYVFGVAAKSNVQKRKVGCVIMTSMGVLLSEGHNDEFGHAEAHALNNIGNWANGELSGCVAYVTHPPCPECAKLLLNAGINDVRVVEAFMKFDGDKARYDLVPPSAIKGMADVFTFGARKYKPNNWRLSDSRDRWIAAAFRHLEAYRMGEEVDPDSGLHHLYHCMTNLAIIVELDQILQAKPKRDEVSS